jgi:hypothetical protein
MPRRSKQAIVSTLFRAKRLLRHQRRLFFATSRASFGLAPSFSVRVRYDNCADNEGNAHWNTCERANPRV